jgi:hypothetical protein
VAGEAPDARVHRAAVARLVREVVRVEHLPRVEVGGTRQPGARAQLAQPVGGTLLVDGAHDGALLGVDVRRCGGHADER